MLFQSFEFFIFFPLVLALRFILPKRFERLIILIASYVFYGWWSWKFSSLLLATTVIDFFAARFIDKYSKDKYRRRLLLTSSIIVNLGLLFFFKYWFWVNELFGNTLSYQLVLPLGISFYTFQSMSYTLDVYFKKIKPEKDFVAFASFVSFFPQLVAGPIERAGHLLAQLDRGPQYVKSFVTTGLSLFAWGAVKKVIFADNLASYANEVYDIAGYSSSLELILGSYAFAFQIYCDFSGYTDMARGIARLMGYELCLNFNSPYLAVNIREFWSRWHISLSTWFRDYLYIPLGGNRVSKFRGIANILITMIIAGIWHGANTTFLIWGLFHGVLIVIYHQFARHKDEASMNMLHKTLSIFITFNLVVIGWVFFRSESVEQAFNVFAGICKLDFSPLSWHPAFTWLMIFPVFCVLESCQKLKDRLASHELISWIAIWIAFFSVIVFGASKASDFIYFQF